MPQPSCSCLSHLSDPRDVSCRVPDLVKYLRIHSVQEAHKDGLARLPHDHQDRSRYKKTHYRVGSRIAQPHTYCPKENGKARPSVRAWYPSAIRAALSISL